MNSQLAGLAVLSGRLAVDTGRVSLDEVPAATNADEPAAGVRFERCLACGEVLSGAESQRLGAGRACRDRLGDDELARRRAKVLTSERAQRLLTLPD